MQIKYLCKFQIAVLLRGLTALTCIAVLFLFSGCENSPEKQPVTAKTDKILPNTIITAEKKVLIVHSYHFGYEWTDGINKGILETLGVGIEENGRINDLKSLMKIKIFYMDTKRNKDEASIKKAALDAKEVIETWQPDVVITSDDNAARFLIVPYFKNAALPFVFCGINWDAGEYDFPCSNVTGMIEVQLVDQILKTLKKYARGNRIAFIKGDDDSARKEADFFENRFGIKLDKRFVEDFDDWKNQYLQLQNESDMILIGNSSSIKGWNGKQAKLFILSNTRVPTGNWDAWMAPFCLVTFANKPYEQGEWSSRVALRILNGENAINIPITTNQKAEIYLNMSLAKQMDIVFPIELIEQSIFVEQGAPD